MWQGNRFFINGLMSVANVKMTGINNIGDIKGTGSVFCMYFSQALYMPKKVNDDRYNNEAITWSLICLFLKFR